MSKHEWKPGDVAICGEELVGLNDDGFWIWVMTGLACLDQRSVASRIRPVVVIDPEDREQVERLVVAFSEQRDWYADTRRQRADAMQAALREFANPTPPKPVEPKGLGAVVEDAEGNRWVLYTSTDSTAPWCDRATSCEWDEVAAVRVLSSGVEVDQ